MPGAKWEIWTATKLNGKAYDGSPYIHWLRHLRDEAALAGSEEFKINRTPFARVVQNQLLFTAQQFGISLKDLNLEVQELIEEILKTIEYLGELESQHPSVSWNESFLRGESSGELIDPWQQPIKKLKEKLPRLHPETVVVGIIDNGIALGHRRFRGRDGSTRFLGAWQTAADRTRLPQFEAQNHLPYGGEVLTADINQHLHDHDYGDWLDEDAFNRATGLEDYNTPFGQRDLGRAVAHGTHVAELAAGFDPEDPNSDKIWMYAVNLPSRTTLGLSGQYLEPYVMWGILRIVAAADAAWQNRNGDLEREGALQGFPIIINLSYGKNGGKRAGDDKISLFLEALNRYRHILGLTPVHIAVPTGNDNLRRGIGLMGIEPNDTRELTWRISHEDQSANYLEIWTDMQEGNPIAVSLSRPGESEKVSSGAPGCHLSAGREARIYRPRSESWSSGKNTGTTVHYLFCTGPSVSYKNPEAAADGGNWTIRVENRSTKRLVVRFAVQSDQSEQPDGVNGKLSYLIAPDYEVYDEVGRVIDSYSYPPFLERPENLDYKENWDPPKSKPLEKPAKGENNVVRRHGSMNSILVSRSKSGPFTGALVVAGYRGGDGRPAPYSGTGSDNIRGQRLGGPSLAGLSDDGPAHLGVIAAGARDGSWVALQGTSFSTAILTAEAALLLLDNRQGWDEAFRLKRRLWNLTRLGENSRKLGFHGRYDIEKLGGGRRVSQRAQARRSHRLGLRGQ